MTSAKDRIERIAAKAKGLTGENADRRGELFEEAYHELVLEIQSAMRSAKALSENIPQFTKHLDDYNDSLVRCALKDTEAMLLLASRVHALQIFNQAAK